MQLSPAEFQTFLAVHSDAPPIVLDLIKKIQAGKTPLIETQAQAKELNDLHPHIPWVVICLILTSIEWDMAPHLDERGSHIKLSFTWRELRTAFSKKDIAVLKRWERERERLIAVDQLCDRCQQLMQGEVPEDEYSGLRPGTLFALTPGGFKIFSSCDWCMGHWEENYDPLWVNYKVVTQ